MRTASDLSPCKCGCTSANVIYLGKQYYLKCTYCGCCGPVKESLEEVIQDRKNKAATCIL